VQNARYAALHAVRNLDEFPNPGNGGKLDMLDGVRFVVVGDHSAYHCHCGLLVLRSFRAVRVDAAQVRTRLFQLTFRCPNSTDERPTEANPAILIEPCLGFDENLLRLAHGLARSCKIETYDTWLLHGFR
jgi:hypothetical protein